MPNIVSTRRSVEELQRLASLRLPLFEADPLVLPEEIGYHEIKSRNGRVLAVAISLDTVPHRPARQRSTRELTVALDPRYKRREAARKQSARARQRIQQGRPDVGDDRLAVQRWTVYVPHGPNFSILAISQKDARRIARAWLGLGRRVKLPVGTYCAVT